MSLETLSWKEFVRRSRSEPGLVIDLRSHACYRKEHYPGAISLPFDEWEERRPELPRGKPVYLYCERGNLALRMGRRLAEEGFRAVAVMSGYPKSCENE